ICLAVDAPVRPIEGAQTACELVLVGNAVTRATAWVEELRPRACHVLASPTAAVDVARLARRLAGRSLGLVLSGGGARGLAHIGVVDALTSGGSTIDRVG